jgi:hypothetical protein
MEEFFKTSKDVLVNYNAVVFTCVGSEFNKLKAALFVKK